MPAQTETLRPHPGERDLLPALLDGWRGRCPTCHNRTLFAGYLKAHDACSVCGQEFHHHRADDLPAWLTMVVVGKILVGALLGVENAFSPPLWVHWATWPVLVTGLALWLLPRFKGAVIGMQWAWRMHGFEGDRG